jgi:TonB family protein
MSWRLLFDNLVAYSLQIGMLVGVAAAIPAVLRLRQPGAKLIYWQILLAACLLLPLQPWKYPAVTGTVQVTTGIATVRAVHAPSQGFTVPRSELALLLLLAGVAIRLGWLASGFWKLRRLRHDSRPLEPAPAWSVEASLHVSDEVASPVTFGWRKPVVLLPARFAALDPQVQEAILCHEIMHVRRGDWLFTVAEEVVRAIFWFHPAIWWLLGEIGLAREQEVDRLSIEITHEREHYMDALLAIAGSRAQLDLAPAPLFLRKRHLKHRVVSIVKESHMSQARLISTLTTGLAVLAAACWLVTGAFPLIAQPQIVSDAAGVTVNLNGSSILHRSPVHYPASALQHGVQGAVSVEVKLDATGNVSDAHVLSGPDELRSAVLQSVLEWHFTHDAAGSTRAVQVVFALPQPAAASESARATQQLTVVAQGNTIDAARQTQIHVSAITVSGLSSEARDQLLATLPVHEGDTITPADLQQLGQRVQAFDEHLMVRRTGQPSETTLVISPGPQVTEQLRRMALAAISPDNMPAPPPPRQLVSITTNPPERIVMGGNVVAASIVSKVPPVYPQLAKSAGVQGVVHLAAVIGKDGTIQELHSLGGPALLIQAALDAVKQWTYQPIFLNGQPVSVETTIDINFTLNQ